MKKLKMFCLIAVISLNAFKCYANDINVEIERKPIEFDVSPIIQNGRTLVPMRKIFEELDCEVEWLAESQTVIATKNDLIIALQIGKNIIIINNIEKAELKIEEFDTAPIIHNGRTMIPVRAISECLRCSVNWDDNTKTVTINTSY